MLTHYSGRRSWILLLYMNNLAIIGAYVNLLQTIGVTTRKDAENWWVAAARHQEHGVNVEEAAMLLMEKEKEFDMFLEQLEQVLYPTVTNHNSSAAASLVHQLPTAALVKTVSNEITDIRTFIPSNGSVILVFIRHFG